MSLVVVGAFLLCWTPYYVVTLLYFAGVETVMSKTAQVWG
jgi:hypothetical protein